MSGESELPIFVKDGGMIIISPENLTPLGDPPEDYNIATRGLNVAWIDPKGVVTVRNHVRMGGEVQSVYAVSYQDLWLLVAIPKLPYNLTTLRHYAYVRLSKNGEVHHVKSAPEAAPWPTQSRSWMSFGGLWMSQGVYWTYNTFELLRPSGFNWSDLKGMYHVKNIFAPFVGEVSSSIAPGSGSSIWALVNADAPGLVDFSGRPLPDAVFKIDVMHSLPQVRHYVITGLLLSLTLKKLPRM